MKRSLPLLAFFICFFLAYSHAQTVRYREDFSVAGEFVDNAYHITTLDGGSMLISTTYISASSRIITLIKLDSAGTPQWNKRFGSGSLRAFRIVQSPDSGYFFTAYDVSNNGNVYTKVDKVGTLIFSYKYSGPAGFTPISYGAEPMAKNNGGFYVSSAVYNSTNGTYCWHVAELDGAGAVVWSNFYSGAYGASYTAELDTTSTGDIVVSGNGIDPGNTYGVAIFLKIDSSGSIIWYKSYRTPGASMTGAYFDLDGNDNIYVSTAHRVYASPSSSMCFMKIDPAGNVVWSKKYSVTTQDLLGGIVFVLSNQEIIVAGSQYFIKANSSGAQICATKHPGLYRANFDTLSSTEFTHSAFLFFTYRAGFFTSDNCGKTCADSTMSFNVTSVTMTDSVLAGSSPLLLFPTLNLFSSITTSPVTSIVCTIVSVPENERPVDQVQIFPVPASDQISFVGSALIGLIEIYDCTGKVIARSNPESERYTLNIAGYPDGLYFFRIVCKDHVELHTVPIVH